MPSVTSCGTTALASTPWMSRVDRSPNAASGPRPSARGRGRLLSAGGDVPTDRAGPGSATFHVDHDHPPERGRGVLDSFGSGRNPLGLQPLFPRVRERLPND